MEFILRIFFTGLIAFIPSEDKTEVTVLLLNVGHAHHLSDGTAPGAHTAIILARSGGCTGDCDPDAAVAPYIYRDKPATVAVTTLNTALAEGGAWILNGSDLTIRKGSASDPDLPGLIIVDDARGTVNGQPVVIPSTAAEREDFSWVANLKQLCSGCTLDSSLLGSNPPAGLVAARFKIRNGKLFTYAVARMGSNVTPANFQRLDGTGSVSSYSQAIASWVGAEIAVSGDSIEIVEEKFDEGPGRSMILTPDENDRVEIAVLNLPAFVPPASSANDAPQVGKHFERFYDLVETPPAPETRLVPRKGSTTGLSEVSWSTIHPQQAVYSELLNQLRLDIGRSAYDRILCPPAQNPLP
ncbi:MAG: hypothetical protein ACLGH0_09105 [Thermoanaerobaculia bacterium]